MPNIHSVRLKSVCVAFLVLGAVAHRSVDAAAFEFGGPITDPIVSATFNADFAALTAHRTIFGEEVNFIRLLGSSGILDLSDAFFGTAAWPDPPQLNMGSLETGITSVAIPASFFSSLSSGSIALEALFTDTNDALFAIDFFSISVQTTTGVVEALFGQPIGNENNGFGIGLADGGTLPSPVGVSILANATFNGFDEAISSISIPAPSTLAILSLAALAAPRRRRP